MKAVKAPEMHKDAALQSHFVVKTFHKTVEAISRDCQSWLDQWSFIAFKSVDDRKKIMRSYGSIIRTIIGLFIKPRINNSKIIYIFEGLKNQEYIAAFRPESVVIIGSHQEKEYAMSNGHAFCWAFPMQSSIYSNMSRGWSYPAIMQLKYWTKLLAKSEQVIFFLQEDTQPLGTFLVYLSRLLSANSSSVCIQHGYFLKYYFPIRNEGALTDFNFVWDSKQAELIGSNKLKTFEIGLPYIAKAKPSSELVVVLVGTGVVGNGSDIYKRSIQTYIKVNDLLAGKLGMKVFYRPHPNEYNDKKLIAELRNFFSLVDSQDKLDQLNGPRALFIGVESSLLFEAGVAGHIVAHLKLDESIPEFEFEFEFCENEVDELFKWVFSIKNKINLVNKSKNIADLSPLERFKVALHQSNLVD